jgi:hypothetical protein
VVLQKLVVTQRVKKLPSILLNMEVHYRIRRGPAVTLSEPYSSYSTTFSRISLRRYVNEPDVSSCLLHARLVSPSPSVIFLIAYMFFFVVSLVQSPYERITLCRLPKHSQLHCISAGHLLHPHPEDAS